VPAAPSAIKRVGRPSTKDGMKDRVTPRVFDADEIPQLVETVSIRGGETDSWSATASIGRVFAGTIVIPQRLAEAKDRREAEFASVRTRLANASAVCEKDRHRGAGATRHRSAG
jgi:hypothetical protein